MMHFIQQRGPDVVVHICGPQQRDKMRTLLVQQLVRHAWLGGNRDIEKADDARICAEAIRMRHEYASDRSEGDATLGLE